ncbi:hypothetical protein HDU92_002988, partial [Lobulomyces angularis]
MNDNQKYPINSKESHINQISNENLNINSTLKSRLTSLEIVDTLGQNNYNLTSNTISQVYNQDSSLNEEKVLRRKIFIDENNEVEKVMETFEKFNTDEILQKRTDNDGKNLKNIVNENIERRVYLAEKDSKDNLLEKYSNNFNFSRRIVKRTVFINENGEEEVTETTVEENPTNLEVLPVITKRRIIHINEAGEEVQLHEETSTTGEFEDSSILKTIERVNSADYDTHKNLVYPTENLNSVINVGNSNEKEAVSNTEVHSTLISFEKSVTDCTPTEKLEPQGVESLQKEVTPEAPISEIPSEAFVSEVIPAVDSISKDVSSTEFVLENAVVEKSVAEKLNKKSEPSNQPAEELATAEESINDYASESAEKTALENEGVSLVENCVSTEPISQGEEEATLESALTETAVEESEETITELSPQEATKKETMVKEALPVEVSITHETHTEILVEEIVEESIKLVETMEETVPEESSTKSEGSVNKVEPNELSISEEFLTQISIPSEIPVVSKTELTTKQFQTENTTAVEPLREEATTGETFLEEVSTEAKLNTEGFVNIEEPNELFNLEKTLTEKLVVEAVPVVESAIVTLERPVPDIVTVDEVLENLIAEEIERTEVFKEESIQEEVQVKVTATEELLTEEGGSLPEETTLEVPAAKMVTSEVSKEEVPADLSFLEEATANASPPEVSAVGAAECEFKDIPNSELSVEHVLTEESIDEKEPSDVFSKVDPPTAAEAVTAGAIPVTDSSIETSDTINSSSNIESTFLNVDLQHNNDLFSVDAQIENDSAPVAESVSNLSELKAKAITLQFSSTEQDDTSRTVSLEPSRGKFLSKAEIPLSEESNQESVNIEENLTEGTNDVPGKESTLEVAPLADVTINTEETLVEECVSQKTSVEATVESPIEESFLEETPAEISEVVPDESASKETSTEATAVIPVEESFLDEILVEDYRKKLVDYESKEITGDETEEPPLEKDTTAEVTKEAAVAESSLKEVLAEAAEEAVTQVAVPQEVCGEIVDKAPIENANPEDVLKQTMAHAEIKSYEAITKTETLKQEAPELEKLKEKNIKSEPVSEYIVQKTSGWLSGWFTKKEEPLNHAVDEAAIQLSNKHNTDTGTLYAAQMTNAAKDVLEDVEHDVVETEKLKEFEAEAKVDSQETDEAAAEFAAETIKGSKQSEKSDTENQADTISSEVQEVKLVARNAEVEAGVEPNGPVAESEKPAEAEILDKDAEKLAEEAVVEAVVDEPVVEEVIDEEHLVEAEVTADEPAAEAEETVDKAVVEEAIVEEAIVDEPVVKANIAADEPAVEFEIIVDEPAAEAEVIVDEPAGEAEVIIDEPAVEAEVLVDNAIVEADIAAFKHVAEGFVDEPIVKAEVIVDEPVVEAEETVDEPAAAAEVIIEEPATEAEEIVDEPVVEEVAVDELDLTAEALVDESAFETEVLVCELAEEVTADEPALEAEAVVHESVVEADLVVDETAVEAEVTVDEPAVEARAIVDEPVVDAGIVADEPASEAEAVLEVEAEVIVDAPAAEAKETVDKAVVEEAIVDVPAADAEVIVDELVVEAEETVDKAVVEEEIVDEPAEAEVIVDKFAAEAEEAVDKAVDEEAVVDKAAVKEAVVDEPAVDAEVIVEEPVVEAIVDEPVEAEVIFDEPAAEAKETVDEPAAEAKETVDEAAVEETVVEEPAVEAEETVDEPAAAAEVIIEEP